MMEKIISGGQTGVDQVVLLEALYAGIAIGGWCLRVGLDANGVNVLLLYPGLKEALTPDMNVKILGKILQII